MERSKAAGAGRMERSQVKVQRYEKSKSEGWKRQLFSMAAVCSQTKTAWKAEGSGEEHF